MMGQRIAIAIAIEGFFSLVLSVVVRGGWGDKTDSSALEVGVVSEEFTTFRRYSIR
jgi:hypothetical protein